MGRTAALQSMLTSIPPDKVSALLRIKNRDSRTPLKEAESEGRKETVELLKSWKQPVLAAHAATYQKLATLQEADKLKSKALTNQREELVESQQQILDLQETNNQMMTELINQGDELVQSQQQIVALQEANNQMTAELTNQGDELVRSQQQIVALQAVNNQMTADMAAMMERLNRLDIYLRTPADTDEAGNQLHEPLG
ncbi:CAP-Gly domain-containing linker protein 1-like [Watersipora subatra]|uniref:CAP-Gly domain-containing linker protein 1-like n=1 Tax=Watersipora subatra TaxID=2589382 RepID=UPI00355BCFBE